MEEKTTYDQGWNARVRGEPYDQKAAKDWRDGWKDCQESPPEDQTLME